MREEKKGGQQTEIKTTKQNYMNYYGCLYFLDYQTKSCIY